MLTQPDNNWTAAQDEAPAADPAAQPRPPADAPAPVARHEDEAPEGASGESNGPRAGAAEDQPAVASREESEPPVSDDAGPPEGEAAPAPEAEPAAEAEGEQDSSELPQAEATPPEAAPSDEPPEAVEAESEPGAIPTEAEAFREGRVWYVIHTYSGHENKVKNNLEHRIGSMDAQDLIYRVVVPTEDEIEIREGQRRTVARKIFPGYMLVQMVELKEDDSDATRAWFIVRNTPGVTGFVGSGVRPVPLEEQEVRRILSQMRVEQPKVKVGFAIGESVRIVEGPFQDFVGQVDEINLDRGKVKVLVSFFGRETPVELDFLQVERL